MYTKQELKDLVFLINVGCMDRNCTKCSWLETWKHDFRNDGKYCKISGRNYGSKHVGCVQKEAKNRIRDLL